MQWFCGTFGLDADDSCQMLIPGNLLRSGEDLRKAKTDMTKITQLNNLK